ncbi:archaeal ribosomal protein L6P [Candidatus Methanoperedens nitroreducens]|uniref:Large ribosomal subunit protein uL6 n=1 Tax=Candidatus Methanoperedens nitratireducens TaxID=1392998 RepID=A0A062V7L5_9EURY|nr:50S ribosomal protein L6 [Candidatus Methanoperedens nitroreducens]KCZ73292.1 archaeal ribosomal protein L6P [Candidatus Methanoperedens nitroreducens]MDJ1422759.1 50S ribosomal protein L6 [Candidatus Methanoperedens sp.]
METNRTIEIPQGVNVTIDHIKVSISGPLGSLQRELWYPGIMIRKADSEVIVEADEQRREKLAMLGTFESHLKNMITGVTKGFEYKMKMVYSHFPIQLKTQGDKLLISNFLGEKKPRKANILGNTKITINGDQVIINGINKDDVGQTAANIQQATKIKRFDPRVFQDGIYLIEWSGR